MAELTIQQLTEDGSSVTYSTAASGGDTADNGGTTFLHIKNGGGSEITATITAQTTSVDNSIYGELTKANASIAIAASGEAFIGPFKPAAFNDGNSELVITYSGVESLTIAALYI
ncbi:MAG: hypothetical protein H8E84_05335 [Flavobacteriales bacterium]|nr:hypothetical protein [Flavobacteriales bacterium]